MILAVLNTWRAQRIMRRSRNSKALQDVPPTLYDFWKSSARHEFNGIPTDAVFFARALDGLLTFFDCVASSSQPCALPSKAADSVWHAWLRLSPLKLEAFCRRHYGRTIPHLENGAMPGHPDAALAACLVRARVLEGLAPEGPRLPQLFQLDRVLKMPKGFGYQLQSGVPGYAAMDERGRMMGRLACPPVLAVAGLLGAGLITQEAYAQYQQRLEQSSSGSSCGSGCGSSMSDGSDGGCSDSGSDSGGSCGSSCGSSCGGGGD
jgi:hypothetical protein